MQNLFDYELMEVLNGDIKCSCGRVHKANIPISLGGDLVVTCKEFASGGRVFLLVDGELEKGTGDIYHEKLSSHGFLVTRFTTSLEDTPSIKVEEGTKIIIGVGGESVVERAKLLALSSDARLIVLPLSLNFERIREENAVLDYGGVRIMRPARSPDKILIDYDLYSNIREEKLGVMLGELYSKVITFCDYAYKISVEGEGCREVVKSGLREIEKLNNIALTKEKESIKKQIEIGLRIGAYMRFAGLSEGGEGQLASTLSRFIKSKSRPKLPYGEGLFLSSVLVSKIYSKFLSDKVCYGVCDKFQDLNNSRKILSLGEGEAIKRATGYDKNYKYKDYKVELHRGELGKIVQKGEEILKTANQKLKQIFRDGGYHLRYYLTAEEMINLITASPFYAKADTLLTFIKNRGLLEFSAN